MSDRLEVRKTYKLYIGGQFPRSESGRTMPAEADDGSLVAHVAMASRKDVRDAVVAARSAQASWAARTAYNRGQILYRIAEILEGRRSQLVTELGRGGSDQPDQEVDASIDRWVWYAGWCDKYAQVLGSANPVAGPYFNFTVPEPTGVVGVVLPDGAPLLALTSRVAPALVPGNTTVVVASEAWPLAAVTFAEILATSDVPAGVVNILTGHRSELAGPLGSHRDVNALDPVGLGVDERRALDEAAAASVTRVVQIGAGEGGYLSDSAQSLQLIGAMTELKTVWHPAGR
jgi:acyl-CoA reductase-like NAD-dependent aldehyde dehydrogenase